MADTLPLPVTLQARAADRVSAQTLSIPWYIWCNVTGNGDHFIEEILRFLRKVEKKICHDLSGLIIVPNGFEVQKRVMTGFENKLRFGGKRITWADVWSKNYCVRLRKHSEPVISTFPQCLYCRKLQEK
jgi:hypothetical protein